MLNGALELMLPTQTKLWTNSNWRFIWHHINQWKYRCTPVITRTLPSTLKGAVAGYCACTAMTDSGSWLTNRNRQKRLPTTMRISRDFVVFAGTSCMFVSSPTTSSLILKWIRQRLIKDAINIINRSLCNYTRNQANTFTRAINQIRLSCGLKFAIGSTNLLICEWMQWTTLLHT